MLTVHLLRSMQRALPCPSPGNSPVITHKITSYIVNNQHMTGTAPIDDAVRILRNRTPQRMPVSVGAPALFAAVTDLVYADAPGAWGIFTGAGGRASTSPARQADALNAPATLAVACEAAWARHRPGRS